MLRRLLFHNFHAVHRFDQWVKHRLTPAGFLALGALLAGGLFGLDVRQTMAYQLFALAFALLAVGFASAALFRGRFEVRRRLPRFGTVGEPLEYAVRVRNLGARPERGLLLAEGLQARPPSFAEFRRSREPDTARRNPFDRYVGYPRWVWLMQRSRGAEAKEVPLPALPGHGEVEVTMRLQPLRRGRVRLDRMCIIRPDPLGLVRAVVEAGSEESLLILPRRYPVSPPALGESAQHRSGGSSASSSVGASEEFVALREYRPGDPMRHLHWKSWARLGEPIVKEFLGEFHSREALLLDTVTDAAGAERFEAAVSVAASLACAESRRAGLLDLVLAAPGDTHVTVGHGVAPTERILEVLACVEACRERRFDEFSERVLRRIEPLSGCICVLLAWDAQRRDLVRRLRAAGVPLLVLVVSGGRGAARLAPGPMADCPQRLRSIDATDVAADLAALSRGAAAARVA